MNDSRSFAAEALLDGVWAITTDYLRLLWAAAERGVALTGAVAAPPTPRQGTSGTAVIPIHGPISRRQDFFSLLFGIQATTTSSIANALRAAVADPGVGQIVLHVDSPGGETDSITELAAEIYEARSRKPIVSFVDTMAGSAAYWLAAQADHIIVTPSGQVGSIGVFALHLDRSGELDDAGIVPTFIQAGKFKTEESPLHPLSAEARAAVQSRVDAFYGMFVKDVARGRGVSVETVRSQFGEGRMVLAKDAVARGMADVVSDRVTARPIRRRIASETAATAVEVAVDDRAEAENTGTMSAFSYIRARHGGPCQAEARAAFEEAIVNLGLAGRAPELVFFRAETELDRQLDPWSPRMERAQHEWAVTFPDRAPFGEVWVSAAIADPEFMRHVVRHEVRHMVQSRALVGDASEVDAEQYASDRMAVIDSLYSGRRAS